MTSKELITVFLSLIFGLNSNLSVAQQVQAGPERLSSPPIKSFHANITNRSGRTTTCDTDTVEFARAEASGSLRPLSVYNVTSIDKAGQWFDTPQDITVYGFTFYAWKGSPGPGVTAKIICNMYLAGADSLPTSVILASDTLEVDTFITGTNTIGPYKRVAVFKTPPTVSVPYILTVENDQAASVSVVANDWDNKEGKQRWMGMGHFSTSGWVHGYEMTLGGGSGVPFDADFVFEPHVRYDINASFNADTTCLYTGGTVNFTNNSVNPILNSTIYNQIAHQGRDSLNYTWEYGDSSAADFVFHGVHTFGAGVDYKVTLTANLVGWNTTCEDRAMEVINPMFSSDFDYNRSGLKVDFTDQSASSLSWLWNFGDGDTASIQNPSHVFSLEGNYEVCLYTVNICGVSDTSCKEVATCNILDNNFSFNNDGLTMAFSTNTQTGAGYIWDFGDGATSIEQNPIHTYNTPGIYQVCLFLSNACFKDTSCRGFELVATGIDNEKNLNLVKIYPNPFNDFLTIEFNEPITNTSVQVFNIFGQRIFAHDNSGKLHKILNINLDDQPNGIYYLRIQSSEGFLEQEIILMDQ